MQQPFVLSDSKTLKLTRELAQEFRAMKPSATERELDQARLKYLRGRAESGLLVPFNWARARYNGDFVRMNGQHSSEMLCSLDEALFPVNGVVHMDDYVVRSETDLASLFQQFDARKSGRSARDVCGAYKGLHPELKELPLDLAQLGIKGIAYFEYEVKGKPNPYKGDELFHMMQQQEFWPFLLWLPELYGIKTPEMRQPQIVAAIYGTYTENEIKAKEFWKSVRAGGDMQEERHPTKTLDEYYVNAKSETDRIKRPRPHALYQAGIIAWNAYMDGKKLANIQIKKNTPDPDIRG